MKKLIHYCRYWGDANAWDNITGCGIKIKGKKIESTDFLMDVTCPTCATTQIHESLVCIARK